MEGMYSSISSYVTTLAHGLDMGLFGTGGHADAEMGHGQDDAPVRKPGGRMLLLHAAPGARMRTMEAAFAGTFTLPSSPLGANRQAKRLPVLGIVGIVDGHA